MNTDYSQPAFPSTGNEFINQNDPTTTVGMYGGLTMLDHFAGQALTGIIINQSETDFTKDRYQEVAAKTAYSIAYEMMEERKKYITS